MDSQIMHPDNPALLPLVIGHRGSSYEAPENTLESFRLAWNEGADGIEADFRLTSDGRIICMHDDTTGRTGGVDRLVSDSTLEELQLLDVGCWRGAAWVGCRIPTLSEVLAALPDQTSFFIELKSGVEIIAPVKQALLESGCDPERIRLLSFDAKVITELKTQLPGWRACWLCDYRYLSHSGLWQPAPDQVLATLRSCGADGLASEARPIVDRAFVEQLRSQGYEIHVWTVDRLTEANRFRELGVTSIMTNRPGWLRRKLSGSEK